MLIGVPREIHRHEHRVGLTPFAVNRLTREGHSVLVEKKAGVEAHFDDKDFESAGAQIVYNPEEVYHRADMVCRVGVLSPDELDFIKPGSTIIGFQHLAVAPKSTVERLAELETTLIGYEIIRDRAGELPVLFPFSEMAGQMSVQIAAHLLKTKAGGRGIMLGNLPGVPPPTVLILGAGGVGHAAARQSLACGCHVVVLDTDINKLAALNREFKGQIVTVLGGLERLEKYTRIADVLIGAVLIPGGRPPMLVTENMVKGMKQGSVVIDISIDQGGCVETSRPTTLDHATFVAHGVVHYCVPNMTANIPRTASRGLASAALPYLVELTGKGVGEALRENPGLAQGVFIYKGKLVQERVGASLGVPVATLTDLLGEEAGS